MRKSLYRITDVGWGHLTITIILYAAIFCYLFFLLCGRDFLPVLVAWTAGIRQPLGWSFYGWFLLFLLIGVPLAILFINIVGRFYMQVKAFEDEINFHTGWRSDKPQMIRREDIVAIQAMPKKFRAYFGSTGFNRRIGHRFSDWIGYSPAGSMSGGLAIRTPGSKYMISCPDPVQAENKFREIYEIDDTPIEPPTLATDRKRERWRKFFRRSERAE